MRATDKEQIEMLREWWDEYGKAIAIAVVVGLLIGFGWRYWSQHQLNYANKASTIYQSLLIADQKKDFATAQHYVEDLTKNFAKTPYAALANFYLARKASEQKNYPLAVSSLEKVMNQSKIDSFKQIARLRTARVFIEEAKPEQALSLLAKVDDKAFDPVIESVKGDAYAALGNKTAAKEAYQKAQEGLTANGIEDPLIAMKLSNPA